MNIVIRVDASIRMGTGHMVRCLTLAEGLQRKQFNVSFLSQRLPGSLCDQIKARGFSVRSLPALETDRFASVGDSSVPHAEWLGIDWQHDAEHAAASLSAMRPAPDWLVVDHYALDRRWEDAVRPYTNHIMVIDDLANRPHDCDILLDQICTDDRHRYESLLPARCKKLMGSHFVLLRPEFAAARARLEFPGRFVNNNLVHVFFGTSDEHGHAIRFSRLLLEHFSDLRLRIVVGDTFVHLRQIADLAREYRGRAEWEQGVTNMAEHMWGCSIAVGTPGMSTWERACMGLPTAHVTNADSQVDILLSLQQDGFCEWLGRAEAITDEAFISGIRRFLNDEHKLASMRHTGLTSVDGRGVQRVIDEMSVAFQ